MKSRLGLIASFCCLLILISIAACNESSRSGSSSSTTTTPQTMSVIQALDTVVGAANISRRSTIHGDKIIKIEYGSEVADGESIVYEVNGQQDFSTRPEDKMVQTGDTIVFFDLVNHTQVTITVP